MKLMIDASLKRQIKKTHKRIMRKMDEFIDTDALLYVGRPVPDEVFPNIYLGGIADGKLWGQYGLPALYVHEMYWTEKPDTTEWLPILRYDPLKKLEYADTNDLDNMCSRIDFHLSREKPLLIHCQGGIERAPLALAYYLVNRKQFTYDEAYALIRAHRPIVLRRDVAWLFQNPLE